MPVARCYRPMRAALHAETNPAILRTASRPTRRVGSPGLAKDSEEQDPDGDPHDDNEERVRHVVPWLWCPFHSGALPVDRRERYRTLSHRRLWAMPRPVICSVCDYWR
jgi:hypothetical protein